MGFCDDVFKHIVKHAVLLKNPELEVLREMASGGETTTEFGSARYVTKVRSRSAKFTEIIMDEPSDEQKRILREVQAYLAGKTLISMERTMCLNHEFNLQCMGLFTSAFARIPYMWTQTLFAPVEGRKKDMRVVDVPEWKETKVLVDVPSMTTFILGSDYMGECKKANLRMAMYIIKQRGGLGLHAGGKILRVKDASGRLIEKSFMLFGLSGTGKTTLTVHDHGLSGDEGVIILQDDVLLMRDDGYCYGTENGFYIKTEGLDAGQPVMYSAATKPHAVLENVWVDENGKVDFGNYTLTSNGRGVILRSDISQCDSEIDLPQVEVMIFITRHKDVVPPIAKLTAEQAAAAFMLGESIETSAGDPEKAGQAKRVVGTNPFIIGPLHEEGNRFLSILRRNPFIECYIMNTGYVGGERSGDKITIQDSVNVMKEIARGSIAWKKCSEWHYLIPVSVEGVRTKKLDAANYYAPEEYARLCGKLREERKNWLAKFPELDDGVVVALTEKKE
ncbi:phosphoenolpyruvate carboxykinase (ATP) [Candidatus Woesearchaeota archaeon CG_4_10_14_0_8_um_filter_47_5]|nr:MAG: phosphoenolpyruvate carboxykinase (ATP) [Candidatus Woesearchaeota archaeon CG_4_10_14_0_8_um_filter_47_5]